MANGLFTRRQLLVGLSVLALAPMLRAAPPQNGLPTVQIWRGEWKDAQRDRVMPVKIYSPEKKGPFPTIVFSHGLGGSREGYEYLGRYWAQHGFVSVHLQHIGSDDALWKNGSGMEGLRGGATVRAALDRPADVRFVVNQLEKLNADMQWPLHGQIDLAHLGMAGHSFGANTTLFVAGAKLPLLPLPLADARFKCAIAMSSPSPFSDDFDEIYSGIHIPMLHMTGTADVIFIDHAGATAADRRIPFDHIHGADAYLITFAGGDHMLFSGQRQGGQVVPSDERNHLLIQEATTAFWNSYLKDNSKAKTYLQTDFARELGKNGVMERK